MDYQALLAEIKAQQSNVVPAGVDPVAEAGVNQGEGEDEDKEVSSSSPRCLGKR